MRFREVDNLTRITNMLPMELTGADKAPMFKDLLGIYATYADGGDELSADYGAVLDIYGAIGSEIDFIGSMYGVFRLDAESDIVFRDRIVSTMIERKTSSTLPELQEAIDSVVDSGRLYILENHNGLPCNVYLTGTADEESVRRSLSLIRKFLPAGVCSIVPVVAFAKWQNVKDQFETWGSLGDEGFIW